MNRNLMLLSLSIVFGIMLFGCLQVGAKACKLDADCQGWQSCNLQNGQCVAKEGFCSADRECNGTNQICSPQTHACAFKAGFCSTDYECAGWQKCDVPTGRCITGSGYCGDDSGCEAWKAAGWRRTAA